MSEIFRPNESSGKKIKLEVRRDCFFAMIINWLQKVGWSRLTA